MSDLIKTLTNLHSLRNFFSQINTKQAESILEKVQRVIAEKKEAEQQILTEKRERLALIEKYKQELKQNGIELSELIDETTGAKKERKIRTPLAPKYQYIDEKGEKKYWTGQGRTPKVIQQALNAGTSLDSFKIDTQN